ncbi:hypothetical protein B0H19DRAFT_1170458 [Mycena capillaripes]|nr:hypothetical protein B0H19DRAFT_1170458 [Mycena capillaripes]
MNSLNSFLSRIRSPAYTTRVPSQPNDRFRQSKFTGRRWKASPLGVVIILAVVVSAFVTLVALLRPRWAGLSSPPPLPPQIPAGPRTLVEQLYDRQSTSLEQAVARYVLKNGRSPPRNYDRWFRFAKSRECLIDDYDQIYRDFEPFYQLATQDSKFFKKMVERGTKIAVGENMGLKTFRVKGGVATTTDGWSSNYDRGWMLMLQNVSTSIPDLNVVINHRDEPRVAFDARIPLAQDGALMPNDLAPFRNAPTPTSKYYTDEKHCLVPNGPKGFMAYANDDNSFLLYSASADFTTDLYPVLSQSKIYPCFSDILFPSEFHYPRSYSSPKYAFPDNVAWEDKKSVLYWRGQSTGGWISGTNYHHFPRFKLLDIARTHGDLMDVAVTAFYEWFCQLDGCDAAAIKAEYKITGEGAPREDIYRYKYVFDVDGNAFSGRFLGLMKSGSLVFKVRPVSTL